MNSSEYLAGKRVFPARRSDCAHPTGRRTNGPLRQYRLWQLLPAVCLLLLASLFPVPANAAPPAFANESPLASDTGYVLLEWTSEEAVALEMAPTTAFAKPRTLYEGRNQSFFVSGLETGDYHFRLRGTGGAVSQPLAVEVEHQSLQQALWLALVGAIVTLAVIFVIVRGARHE